MVIRINKYSPLFGIIELYIKCAIKLFIHTHVERLSTRNPVKCIQKTLGISKNKSLSKSFNYSYKYNIRLSWLINAVM
jgi:hypothetical protein